MHKGLQSPSLCSRAARLVCFAVNISIAIIPMAQVSWRMAVRCTSFAVKQFSSGHPPHMPAGVWLGCRRDRHHPEQLLRRLPADEPAWRLPGIPTGWTSDAACGSGHLEPCDSAGPLGHNRQRPWAQQVDCSQAPSGPWVGMTPISGHGGVTLSCALFTRVCPSHPVQGNGGRRPGCGTH